MGPELDPHPKSEASAKTSSVHRDPRIHQDPQDILLPCMNNYKDESLVMELPSPVRQTAEPLPVRQISESDEAENEEINITDVTNSGDLGVVGSDCTDATESSSSFGDTVSATETGEMLDEVQSQLRGDHTSVSQYDGCYDMFRMRNKKLTAHWRSFIRPLMWRCKWMELQIKKLQSQALAYDKELAEYDQRKKFEYERSTSEDFDAKLHPFSGQFQRNKAMKRKKRKRVEDTADIALYMSQHNFFSYYESKKSVPDGASVEVDFGNLGKGSYHNDEFGTSDRSSLEFQDEDSSFEALFRNIEMVQSRVRKLILRVDKVVYENSGKISSMKKFSSGIPCNASDSSAQNALAPSENGLQVESLCIGSQHPSERNMGDLLMLDGAVSRHGEGTSCSEMIGSTDQLQVGDLFTNAEDEVLIDNEQAKEELHDFEKFRDQFGEKPLLSEEEQKANHPPVSEADPVPSKANVGTMAKKRKRKTCSRR